MPRTFEEAPACLVVAKEAAAKALTMDDSANDMGRVPEPQYVRWDKEKGSKTYTGLGNGPIIVPCSSQVNICHTSVEFELTVHRHQLWAMKRERRRRTQAEIFCHVT